MSTSSWSLYQSLDDMCDVWSQFVAHWTTKGFGNNGTYLHQWLY